MGVCLEDSLQELVLSSYHVGPKEGTPAVRLDSKQPEYTEPSHSP